MNVVVTPSYTYNYHMAYNCNKSLMFLVMNTSEMTYLKMSTEIIHFYWLDE